VSAFRTRSRTRGRGTAVGDVACSNQESTTCPPSIAASPPSSTLHLALSGASETTLAAFVFGFAETNVPLLGGVLVPQPDAVLLRVTDAIGRRPSTPRGRDSCRPGSRSRCRRGSPTPRGRRVRPHRTRCACASRDRARSRRGACCAAGRARA
jgi:hypothetical protein